MAEARRRGYSNRRSTTLWFWRGEGQGQQNARRAEPYNFTIAAEIISIGLRALPADSRETCKQALARAKGATQANGAGQPIFAGHRKGSLTGLSRPNHLFATAFCSCH